MKFDIMSYLENYKTLEFITGSQSGAFWLCTCVGLIVWAISFFFVRIIFKYIFGFCGNSKPMSWCYVIISTITTSVFYKFLDTFKVPIAWFFQHWQFCLLLFIGFIVVVNIVPFIKDMYYHYCNSKNKQ